MGAIERNGYRFVPEFSVTYQKGAVHVYRNGKYLDEITFDFSGKYPDVDQIEELVEQYCKNNWITPSSN
ncbi:YbxH family protein [Bacillus smithii]|uniref:YbxH family protein n=1 Tax=Bacillus smithii TaxID=1479 RepID=UPI002E1B5C49|nr:YbxH family protein [Bacillus smithii]